MGATAVIGSLVFSAASTAYQIHNANEQRDKAQSLANEQNASQNKQIKEFTDQQEYQRQTQANEQELNTLLTEKRDSSLQIRDQQKKARARGASSTDRSSTILTSPRGLAYEDTQKTLIGQ